MKQFINTAIVIISLSQIILPQVTISGRITDDSNNPLPSANIFLKETYDGASSNPDGTYSFVTTENGPQILAVSYVGYQSQELAITISGNNIKHDFKLKEEASTLNTVVISAGSFEASDEKKSVILRPMDIVTTASTADIYSALSTLPGTQQIGEETGLFVRGGSASEARTIIDDMSVQKPFYSSVPDVASRGRFSPFLFKGMVFSSGGYSARYGQALSSALILNTVDLAPANATSINLMAVGFGGSHTQRWENTSLSAEAGYYNMSPYFKIQKTKQKWDYAPVSAEGQVIFRHKFSSTGIFKLHSNYSDGYLRLFLKNLDEPGNDDKYGLKNRNFLLNTSYSDIITGEWSLTSALSYSRDIDNIDINNDKVKVLDNVIQTKVILSRRIIDGAFITFGGELHHSEVRSSFNLLSAEINQLYSSAFAETDIFFTNDLAARIGIRGEHSDLLDKSNIAPRLSLAYRLGTYDQVSLAYGRFYQNPDKDLLFETPDLDFENSEHYIANYQYLGDKFTFRLEGYYKRYSELVRRGSNSLLSNGGSGYAKGIDVFLRGTNLINNADFWFSYSYLDTRRNYRNFPELAVPVFAAPHTFSAVYKQVIASLPAILSFTYSYASGRPYFNPNNPRFHADRTTDYSKLSMNFSYVTNLFNNFTVFFISVDNLFGINNVFSYRYSSDGKIREAVLAPINRSFFIGMFISLGDSFNGV